MKATFALLTDLPTHNFVRKITWEAQRSYQTGLDTARLAPHVSLKQPFEIADLPGLEDYMAVLAASTPLCEVHLTEIQAIPFTMAGTETGILWFDVEETATLRGLHDRLNQELPLRFGDTRADNDGPGYHFHLTIAIGNQPLPVYQQIARDYARFPVERVFTARQLALFVYDDGAQVDWGYMTYKILPLGGLE